MISIIIPTLNGGAYIPALVDVLSKQEFSYADDRLEIIFVDSESDDGSQAMVTDFAARAVDRISVKLLPVKRADFDHGATRNHAWRQAEGDIILFLTQDALPVDKDYISNLICGFSDEKLVMISGRQVPRADANPVERLTRAFNYPEKSFVRTQADIATMGIKAYFFSDACAAYRRSFLEEMGGFEEPILTNEDMLMAANALAAGYKVGYCAEAQVYHSHNFTLRYQYKRNFDVSVFLTQHAEAIKSGGTTKEGIRMVLFTEKQLFLHLHFLSMFRCVFESAAKFLGNRAGKSYMEMTRDQIIKKTSNPAYWRRIWKEK